MNVLFALHNTLGCNSASHVDGIARVLCEQEFDCLVAVPDKLEEASRFAPFPYKIATFNQVLKSQWRFADGRGPDVFHSWTPRELLRKFHSQLKNIIDEFQTIIHMEDNEEYIAQSQLGEKVFAQACEGRLFSDYPDGLTHPVLQREFFRSAAGATVLIDKLREHVPLGLPTTTFWPAVDTRIWHQRPRNDALRERLGIRKDEIVLTYHGNTHSANFREVLSLYLAVALLNREGTPTRLVRVGIDHLDRSPEYERWADQFTISLGYIVDRQELSNVLAMADLYVQPGASDSFNDYRFPSKLPEFFAMGRPVILPKSNIGTFTKHLVDAYVLENADGESISTAVKQICANESLYRTLSVGALEFSRREFCWEKSARAVAALYARCSNCPQRVAAEMFGNQSEKSGGISLAK